MGMKYMLKVRKKGSLELLNSIPRPRNSNPVLYLACQLSSKVAKGKETDRWETAGEMSVDLIVWNWRRLPFTRQINYLCIYIFLYILKGQFITNEANSKNHRKYKHGNITVTSAIQSVKYLWIIPIKQPLDIHSRWPFILSLWIIINIGSGYLVMLTCSLLTQNCPLLLL